ncbi:MAG: hypothetical protein AAB403_17805, partial [Planctomycetota bacterium]
WLATDRLRVVRRRPAQLLDFLPQRPKALHAVPSSLVLKLFGSARHSQVMSHVFDEGLPLFAGLNVVPKGSFLTEFHYVSRRSRR